jgi:lysophospholipase L1-like esterase
MSGGPPRRAVAGAAVALIAFALALGLAEACVRWLRPEAASLVQYPCFYAPDPVTGFRYQPGGRGTVSGHFEFDHEVEMNSLGFYDAEPLPAPALRILAVGDSFTAALNVARDEVWTALLERKVREYGLDADVVNVGLDGTGTDVQLALLREYVPRFRPQFVLVAFFANDVEDVRNGRFTRECYRDQVLSYQTPAQRDALREQVDDWASHGWLRRLSQRSWLARLALVAAEGPANPYRLSFRQPSRAELGLGPELMRAREAWPRRSFEELARFASECACRLIVVPVPARRELGASRDLVRELVKGLPLEVVDVLARMRGQLEKDQREPADLYFRYDAHLNAYGNRVFAEMLAESVDWKAARSAAAPEVHEDR